VAEAVRRDRTFRGSEADSAVRRGAGARECR
jgi:hypothetical protein